MTDLCVEIEEIHEKLSVLQHEQEEKQAAEQLQLQSTGSSGDNDKGVIILRRSTSNHSPTNTASYNEKPLQLAVLGRINVGKSTLVNALLRQEQVITYPSQGLTRNAISIPWSYKGPPVQIVDMAGL